MRIHWLFKYYFAAILIILTIIYYIENSEPYVNWALYSNVSEIDIKNAIIKKNCMDLENFYNSEYVLNYKKNFFGFDIRKDKESKRGLNLLKLLKYHKKKYNCS